MNMKIRDNFGELTEKCQAKLLKLEYQYMWIIKNFKDLYFINGHYDESTTFSTGQMGKYQWKLRIYAGGYDSTDFIGICPFLLNNTSHKNVKTLFEISLMNKDDQVHCTQQMVFTKSNLIWASGIISIAKRRADLVTNSNVLLPNGELRLSCGISFDAPSTVEDITELQYSQYYQKSQLDNFEQLFGNEKFSDFKLIIGKNEFPVHQAILATRSPVFEAMFLTNMRESQERKAEIEDVDPDVMMHVLRYIYVGKVGKIQEITDKVLVVADKYQLDALKQVCEDILADQLSTDNVYETLKLADNINAKNLKGKAIDFFKKNFEKLAAVDHFRSNITSLSTDLQTDIICASAPKK